VFMTTADNSIVNVAVPVIRRGLDASGGELQLVVSGYVLSYGVLLVTGARLGDLLGYRQVFLGGLFCFTIASLACGLAPSVLALIGARWVQGGGAAMMVPQVLSAIQLHFARSRPRTCPRAVLGRVGSRRGRRTGARRPVDLGERPGDYLASDLPDQRADRHRPPRRRFSPVAAGLWRATWEALGPCRRCDVVGRDHPARAAADDRSRGRLAGMDVDLAGHDCAGACGVRARRASCAAYGRGSAYQPGCPVAGPRMPI
jgi:hypothetical protein